MGKIGLQFYVKNAVLSSIQWDTSNSSFWSLLNKLLINPFLKNAWWFPSQSLVRMGRLRNVTQFCGWVKHQAGFRLCFTRTRWISKLKIQHTECWLSLIWWPYVLVFVVWVAKWNPGKKRVILNTHRIKQIEESPIHCCYVNLLSKRGRLHLFPEVTYAQVHFFWLLKAVSSALIASCDFSFNYTLNPSRQWIEFW